MNLQAKFQACRVSKFPKKGSESEFMDASKKPLQVTRVQCRPQEHPVAPESSDLPWPSSQSGSESVHLPGSPLLIS